MNAEKVLKEDKHALVRLKRLLTFKSLSCSERESIKDLIKDIELLKKVKKVGKNKRKNTKRRYIKNFRKEHYDYIHSKRWKNKRDKILSRDNHKCTKCGYDKMLQVHHLTYDRFKNEKLSDLVTLCSRCHAKEHNKIK